MDKFFLLTYTCIDYDGFRHSHHAWFSTEEKMQQFINNNGQREMEIDLAIEILSHREIMITT